MLLPILNADHRIAFGMKSDAAHRHVIAAVADRINPVLFDCSPELRLGSRRPSVGALCINSEAAKPAPVPLRTARLETEIVILCLPHPFDFVML